MVHYPWAATERVMTGQEVILKASSGQLTMSYRNMKTVLSGASAKSRPLWEGPQSQAFAAADVADAGPTQMGAGADSSRPLRLQRLGRPHARSQSVGL